MRIVYLHQYFHTPEMVGATRSYELAKRLVAKGHQVHMVCADAADLRPPGVRGWYREVVDGIDVHWCKVPYSNKMSTLRRFRSFFSFALRASVRAIRLRPEMVYASSTPLTIAIPGIAASRLGRAPMVLELRDLWPTVPIEMGVLRDPVTIFAAKLLERIAYRSASHIVALAPGMAKHAESIAPNVPTTIIPNAADLEVFAPNTIRGNELRERYEWLGNRPMALYAGALGRLKGVAYLVQVAEAMLTLNPVACFVVAGEGQCFAEIREQALRAGVLDKNFFMIGGIAKKDVAAWMSAADMALVMRATVAATANRDSVSNKFFDALAAGRPTASNFTGWSSDMALEHQCGITFDAADPALAAQEIEEVLIDKSWLAEAGVRARCLAERSFDRDALARDLEAVIESVAIRSTDE